MFNNKYQPELNDNNNYYTTPYGLQQTYNQLSTITNTYIQSSDNKTTTTNSISSSHIEKFVEIYEKIVGGSSSPPPTAEILKPKILCVGLVCIDIVQTVKNFPEEDSDSRCSGNASNDCTVLSLLGSQCEFLGTLTGGHHLAFLQDDMEKYNINYSHCPRLKNPSCLIPTVILSLNSGTRTILHHNPNLPELSFDDFKKIKFDDYSWIYFEGRNISNVLTMIQYIEDYNKSCLTFENSDCSKITISVELEKPNSELLDLLAYADVVFLAKDFAQSRGCNNMSETLRSITRDVKSGDLRNIFFFLATIICAWGDRGTMTKTPDGIIQSPAFSPFKIVDSLGAGDTFIAAVIHYLNYIKSMSINNDMKNESKSKEIKVTTDVIDCQKITHNKDIESSEYSKTAFINQSVLQSAITFGCQIAGKKISHRGYDDLKSK
ncbi:hypothetical protein HCN44_010863 [Aphidius gifuensis]|uniref:Carbohydrate kinase PfkB domain-containing protein n=1 Tax=Aphidius gifuensis TaxID=684658 RepID=A0A834XIB1_APHGI|nr:hypothetical protein HCN44_010863 [Aphidius gifuensis]